MNPFEALGLPADPGLDDEQVRQAWRRTAAATHPDQPAGGDPAAYAAGAAAWQQLRTAWGRSEALADLADASPVPEPDPMLPGPAAAVWQAIAQLPARARHGKPARLVIRTLTAVMIAVLAQVLVPGTPSAPAVTFGAGWWWLLTVRGDLAPPPGR